MEEQKRQIEEKLALKNVDKERDREFFHKIGHQSSDIYYVNEDRRIAKT